MRALKNVATAAVGVGADAFLRSRVLVILSRRRSTKTEQANVIVASTALHVCRAFTAIFHVILYAAFVPLRWTTSFPIVPVSVSP